jgi:hypothetical protein
MELFKKTTNLALYYAPELFCAVAIWTGKINGKEFRVGADSIEELLRENRTGKLMTCSSPMRIVDREATTYLSEEWLPRVAGGILHYWADVVPSLSRREKEQVEQDTVLEVQAIPGIVLAQFATIDKAKEWLQTK